MAADLQDLSSSEIDNQVMKTFGYGARNPNEVATDQTDSSDPLSHLSSEDIHAAVQSAMKNEKTNLISNKNKPFFSKSRNESTINAYDIIPGAPLYEAALHGITGTGAQLAGNVIGAIKHYGERGTAAEEEANKIAQEYTYQPRGQIIKKVLPAVTEKVGNVIEESKLAPLLMQPEFMRIGEFAKPVAEQTGISNAAQTLKDQFTNKQPMAYEPINLGIGETKTTTALPNENEQILAKVGMNRGRESSINNDQKNATSQYLTAKATKGIYADEMSAQLSHEKDALNNHFGSIENELGGIIPRQGTEFQVTDKMDAGKTIRKAAEDALDEHNQKTIQLYDKAKQEFGDKPVELGKLNEFLKANENFTFSEEQNLQKGIQSFLSRNKLLDEQGNVKPMTVGKSEELRQFINKKYNYQTKNLGGELKSLIDDDVFENVGGDTFETARKHFQVGKEIYDNPKAMNDLLNVEGTNEKIKTADIMDKVTTLDESQFNHMFNVFKETNKTKAINQIQTSLINRIKMAGQSAEGEPWNGNAALKERAKLSQKLQTAFQDNPEILQKIDDGIKAGKLVSIDTKYHGAAVQLEQLQSKLTGITKQAGRILGMKGGPIGVLAGEHLATKGASELSKRKQMKLIKKEIKPIKLSDIGKE